MEEHVNAALMMGEEDDDHHHPHHHHHHHEEDDDETQHEIHEDDEHMDIEPNRIEGVSSTVPNPHLELIDEFWDREPTKDEMWEMKKANNSPSEWLKLLCKDWAEAGENLELIETMDSKFETYKPYLKGKLSSQLLCRLCIPFETASSNSSNNSSATATSNHNSGNDFMRKILGIRDEFDRAYVIAQVERFCALYDVRGIRLETATVAAASVTTTANRFSVPNNEATAAAAAALYGDLVSDVHQQAIAAAVTATATASQQQQAQTQAATSAATAAATQPRIAIPPHFLTADATAAAVAAAQQAQAQAQQNQVAAAAAAAAAAVGSPAKASPETADATSATASSTKTTESFVNNRSAQALLTKAQQQAKSAERALEQERRQNAKREQKRLSQDKKIARQRDREYLQHQKHAEKLAREQAREDKRNRKLIQRQERERFAQEQKEAALQRAAELVASNRVPIEITRAGTYRGKGVSRKHPHLPTTTTTPEATALSGPLSKTGSFPTSNIPKKRRRSAIVVSTASDLDRIVTHSQNLWSKYNAIAKEHNQRVNWITVAKELGIHVKVREKYARMHSRACQRNFDFVANGFWKIKDHPEVFQEPTPAEQKAKMPPPLPPPIDTTVVMPPSQVEGNHEAALAASGDTNVEQKLQQGQAQAQPPEQEQEPIVKGEPAVSNAAAQEAAVAVPGTAGPIPPPVSVSSPAPPQQHHHHLGIPNSVDAAAAAATAAAVVDAAGVGGATIDMHHVVELTAAPVTLVEGGSGSDQNQQQQQEQQQQPHGGIGSASSSNPVAFEM